MPASDDEPDAGGCCQGGDLGTHAVGSEDVIRTQGSVEQIEMTSRLIRLTATPLRALLVALLVMTLHYGVTEATFPMAYTLAMSEFDEGPTPVGSLGRALMWVHEHILAQPIKVGESPDTQAMLRRAKLASLLNSLVWGLSVVLALLAINTHREQHLRRSTRGG